MNLCGRERVSGAMVDGDTDDKSAREAPPKGVLLEDGMVNFARWLAACGLRRGEVVDICATIHTIMATTLPEPAPLGGR